MLNRLFPRDGSWLGHQLTCGIKEQGLHRRRMIMGRVFLLAWTSYLATIVATVCEEGVAAILLQVVEDPGKMILLVLLVLNSLATWVVMIVVFKPLKSVTPLCSRSIVYYCTINLSINSFLTKALGFPPLKSWGDLLCFLVLESASNTCIQFISFGHWSIQLVPLVWTPIALAYILNAPKSTELGEAHRFDTFSAIYTIMMIGLGCVWWYYRRNGSAVVDIETSTPTIENFEWGVVPDSSKQTVIVPDGFIVPDARESKQTMLDLSILHEELPRIQPATDFNNFAGVELNMLSDDDMECAQINPGDENDTVHYSSCRDSISSATSFMGYIADDKQSAWELVVVDSVLEHAAVRNHLPRMSVVEAEAFVLAQGSESKKRSALKAYLVIFEKAALPLLRDAILVRLKRAGNSFRHMELPPMHISHQAYQETAVQQSLLLSCWTSVKSMAYWIRSKHYQVVPINVAIIVISFLMLDQEELSFLSVCGSGQSMGKRIPDSSNLPWVDDLLREMPDVLVFIRETCKSILTQEINRA